MNNLDRRRFINAMALAASGLCTRNVFGDGASNPAGRERDVESYRSIRTQSGTAAAATVNPHATRAAIETLRAGGNAIDAAIAAGLMLTVVDSHNSGIGGGCLMLIRTAEGGLHAIDGRETAPSRSSPDMFVRDGKPQTELSQTGPLASGVPGEIAAMHLAHSKHGKLSWDALFAPAIEVANAGHVLSQTMKNTLRDNAETIQRFPESAKVLLSADSSTGILVQKDLGATLSNIASHGPDWFYRGPFAEACDRYMQSVGGVLSRADFQKYVAKEREPLVTTYRSNQIIGFPTPSSGGMHIAQMLNMLELYDVADINERSPADYYHLLAECMKRAFADRAFWLGDSDFVNVPQTILDKAYATQLAATISMDKSVNVPTHGIPPGVEMKSFQYRKEDTSNVLGGDAKKHTTHLTVVDAMGNWVAMTATVNTSWGSKVVVPGTGVVLNNQMDDFSISPGTPNAFGLVGSQANEIQPGKRPLSSMSPTIVLDQKREPILTCGAAGGPRIINTTLQIIVGCLDLKKTIDQSLGSARIHHQWRPDQLTYESVLGGMYGQTPSEQTPRIVERLKSKGHELKSAKYLAVAQGIAKNGNVLTAASDPRVDSSAAAF